MKRLSGVALLVLAGCRPIPGAPALPSWIPRTPAGVRLLRQGERTTNGVQTGLDLHWDLGGRPLREVRYGGVTQRGGAEFHPKGRTLKASFQKASGRTTLKVVLEETEDHGSSTSATSGEVAVDGGLGKIEVVPVDPSRMDEELTLLRWKGKGKPFALTVAFR